jgi:hypothetical protein
MLIGEIDIQIIEGNIIHIVHIWHRFITAHVQILIIHIIHAVKAV